MINPLKPLAGRVPERWTTELPLRDKHIHQLVVKQSGNAVFYEPGRWSLVVAPFDSSSVNANQRFH
jgi:hypothetical protein